MKNKELAKWLRLNLGKQALAPLTSTDSKALDAAVAIIELYNCSSDLELLRSFACCVRQMQESVWPLAYHSIAFVMDWRVRSQLWRKTGLQIPLNVGICEHEPD